MKAFKSTIELFAEEAMSENQMNFLKGGGEPKDTGLVPPGSNKTENG